MNGRRLAAPLAAGLAVAAYVAAFRRYGIFDPVDEGLLLVQAWRAAHGQVPYVDFHTGYGPLYFRMQALLLAAGGMDAVRWALVVVHGMAAGLLYALARRLAGAPLATVAVALQVAFFLPVAPARGAPFNVPYPAWYAGLGGVAAALLLADERRGRARVALTGVVCGLVAAIKPSSGVLLGAGAAAALALEDGGRAARALLVLIALGALALVEPAAAPLAAWVLVPPVIGLAFLGTAHGGAGDHLAARLALLAGGFALVAAALFLPVLAALGPARFAHDVLLLGAGVAEVYAVSFPWPAALAVLAGMLAFLGRGRAAVAFGLTAAAALALTTETEAASTVSALREGAEQAALAGVPVIVWSALAELRREKSPALTAPAAVSTLAVLQMYPRADFLHILPLGVLLLPLALVLWRRVVERLPVPRRAARVALVVLPLALAAARFAPTAAALSRVATGRLARVDLDGTRLVVEAEGALALRSIAAAAAELRAAGADEPVLAFPACGIVLFVAGMTPVGPHDYFFPGRPDRSEAAALAARLAAAPPRLAVVCSAADTPLAAAWDYYPELTTFLRTRYRQRAVHPPYFVLEAR